VAASTCGQLGILAGLQQHWPEAGRWLIKSIRTLAACNDPHSAQRNTRNFLLFYRQAPAADRAKLKAMWQEAGLGDLPDTPSQP